MNYYDYDKIISYNIPVNILIGERGVGKSYGAKKFVIKQFLKKGYQFLYLRRYQVELDKIFQKDNSGKDFFSDIRNEFPDDELTTKGHKFYINDQIARLCL